MISIDRTLEIFARHGGVIEAGEFRISAAAFSEFMNDVLTEEGERIMGVAVDLISADAKRLHDRLDEIISKAERP